MNKATQQLEPHCINSDITTNQESPTESEIIGKTLCIGDIDVGDENVDRLNNFFRIEKICANGDDNLLMVTKKGYNPTEVWPKRTGNKTGAIDAVLTVLTPPVIIKIPEGKVGPQKFNFQKFS